MDADEIVTPSSSSSLEGDDSLQSDKNCSGGQKSSPEADTSDGVPHKSEKKTVTESDSKEKKYEINLGFLFEESDFEESLSESQEFEGLNPSHRSSSPIPHHSAQGAESTGDTSPNVRLTDGSGPLESTSAFSSNDNGLRRKDTLHHKSCIRFSSSQDGLPDVTIRDRSKSEGAIGDSEITFCNSSNASSVIFDDNVRVIPINPRTLEDIMRAYAKDNHNWRPAPVEVPGRAWWFPFINGWPFGYEQINRNRVRKRSAYDFEDLPDDVYYLSKIGTWMKVLVVQLCLLEGFILSWFEVRCRVCISLHLGYGDRVHKTRIIYIGVL